MDLFNEHTFTICAYKESEFLEECIKSIINQEIKSNIIMVTSTPNVYIESLAKKYNIKLYIRSGKPDIQNDWNFAYSKAKTKYVTIAHQDDIYEKNYVKKLKRSIDNDRKQIIFFTKYKEIKNGKEEKITLNLKIKSVMLYPLKNKTLRGLKFVRRMILSLGSPICCPSVTYNKDLNGEVLFTSNMKCSLDWDTWYKLSQKDGEFVYLDEVLMYHRIHEKSETSNSIANNVRQSEDYKMFCKFWPKYIAKFLVRIYSKSLETNKI